MRLNSKLPAEDVYECKNLETLKLSTLECILEGWEWNVGMLDDYQPILTEEEEWSWRISDDFVETLASLDDETVADAATKWAETDEMRLSRWTPNITREVIEALRQIAARAKATHRPMFLYHCL